MDLMQRFGVKRLIYMLFGILPLNGEEVTIMAANISSGNGQSYDPGEGVRIFKGLKPDIVLIQEFNIGSNTDAQLRALVTDAFGAEFSYVEEGKPSGDIQNGVISRFPILQSGIWDDDDMSNREFVWAQIDVPGEKNLWVISVHFKASSSGASRRVGQAEQLAEYIEANVPADDYLVIGGDFNAQNRTESFLNELDHLVKVTAPWPVDRNGDGDTNAGRSRPYDWVMVEPDLNSLEVPTVLGGRSYANGIVFDSRVFTPLSAVAPVLAGDSGASQMQHMAVMRTYDFPPELDDYESWVVERFSAQEYAQGESIWGALADPDGDASVNLLEYAFGTDPTVAGSREKFPKVTIVSGEDVVSFLVREGSALTYELQVSDNLSDFVELSGEVVSDGPVSDGFKMRTVSLPPSDKKFFRLKIVR